ncbi:hypothetical protein J1614_012183 [Plenodomus biglobosus]|nr:hypothetical protein J1614_012183 [Plenodomus biglobosus]
MHVDAVVAWIYDLQLSTLSRSSQSPHPLQSRKRKWPDYCACERPHKTRCVALAEMASPPDATRALERKRPRTPSPPKRQFPTDAHSSDPDSPNEVDGRTPRQTTRIHPIPDLSRSYIDILGAGAESARSPLRSRSHTQSQSQSASSARSTSPKKVTSLWDVGSGVTYTSLANSTASRRGQLGPTGMALLDVLEDVADGPVFASSLKPQLREAGIEKIKAHQLDGDDHRPMAELTAELCTILTINTLSHRCAEARDHESEWNNRVHTKVLELALGNDEARVGFRSVVAARITPAFRPTHSPGLPTGKIVDYAIFLEPSHLARDAIAPLVPISSASINHVGYEALRTRPIAVSIETKTESRTVEEAKVQLGVWLAGQVARMEDLIQQAGVLESFERVQDGEAISEPSGHGRRRNRASNAHMLMQTQQQNPAPTTNTFSLDAAALLSQIVFPLLDVQSENWSLFLGRVCPDLLTSMSSSNIQKPSLPIQIFHSIPLGNTANIIQTYRLVKSLKALRAWIDTDFRMWWDKVLNIDGGGEGGS